MSNSTEEFWSLTDGYGNATSLHQWGWSVTTVGGSRYDLPPRRGSDMVFAYRPGQVHRNKMPDARTITLLMFMVGWDPATGNAVGDQRTQWNDNWERLRRAVYEHYQTDGMINLTRRWRLTTPTFPTVRNGLISAIATDPGVPPNPGTSRVVAATAAAEMTGNMAPSMTGRFRSDFQLDFVLADPFFYGAWVDVDLNPGDVKYVWNDGHDVSAHKNMEIELVGPLTNPILTNFNMSPDSWVKYNGTIPAGTTVKLNVGDFTAETGNRVNKIGLISNYGGRFWFSLLPGTNRIGLDASGSGHCKIRFCPPYV